jgi:hypothetical protein
MDDFNDNLPLDGEVYKKDDVRVYIYRGYLVGKPNQCAVHVKGEGSTTWVERSLLTPVSHA